MPLIDPKLLPVRTGSGYPKPLDAQLVGRSSVRVGDAGGITQFGANIVMLEPGAKSSLRHWHEKEDEFAIVLSGDLVLVEDTGETPLQFGQCVAWPAGQANGHHIVNRSSAPGSFLVIGSRIDGEIAHYSEHDLRAESANGQVTFTRADGSPIEPPAS